MRTFWWVIEGFLFLLILPFVPLFYVMCRVEAKPCPSCGDKWFTELVGDWDGEDWKCRSCGYFWITKGAKR